MKSLLFTSIALLCAKNTQDSSVISGANIAINPHNKMTVTDSSGIARFENITAGTYTITVTHAGLQEKTITVTIPSIDAIDIFLQPKEEEEEIIITSTRSGRSINNIPSRVETISGEELAEKANMKPGDIRMMLNESTGIQTQQTSATSYNSSIRIQGLDGGIPNY